VSPVAWRTRATTKTVKRLPAAAPLRSARGAVGARRWRGGSAAMARARRGLLEVKGLAVKPAVPEAAVVSIWRNCPAVPATFPRVNLTTPRPFTTSRLNTGCAHPAPPRLSRGAPGAAAASASVAGRGQTWLPAVL